MSAAEWTHRRSPSLLGNVSDEAVTRRAKGIANSAQLGVRYLDQWPLMRCDIAVARTHLQVALRLLDTLEQDFVEAGRE